MQNAIKVNFHGRGCSFGELKETITVNGVNKDSNFIQNLQKEVKQNPQLAVKLMKALIATGTTLNSWLVLATPVMAQTALVSPDIIMWGKILIATVFISGLIIALLALMIAGISKMVLKRKFGEEWRKDVLSGLRDMILAPFVLSLVLMVIYYFADSIPFFNFIKPAVKEAFGVMFKK